MSYRAPAFQVYAAEFLGDFKVRSLTVAQRGVLADLWCVCWRDRFIPDSVPKLARLVNVPEEEFKHLWPDVREFFVRGRDGKLHSKRLERQRADLNKFHRSRVAAGRKGGQARAHQLVSTQAQPKHSRSTAIAEGTPSSLTSTSSSTAEKSTEKESPRSVALVKSGRAYGDLVLHLQQLDVATLAKAAVVEKRTVAAEVWFAYWQAMRGHRRALYSPEREKQIMRALAANRDDLSELLYVVDGADRDPWANGSDPRAGGAHDDPGLLLRDRAHIERFAGLCTGWKAGTPHPMAVKYGMALAAHERGNGAGL